VSPVGFASLRQRRSDPAATPDPAARRPARIVVAQRSLRHDCSPRSLRTRRTTIEAASASRRRLRRSVVWVWCRSLQGSVLLYASRSADSETSARSDGSIHGRLTVNFVPIPGVLCTSTSPPRDRTYSRVWYAPIPIPFAPFVLSKGLKSR